MSLINSRLHFGNLRLIINADISFVIYPRFLCQFFISWKIISQCSNDRVSQKIFQEYKHDFSYKSRDI